jgi:hypothetical protein
VSSLPRERAAWSPEERLLLLLARGEPTDAEGDEARLLLSSDPDWTRVVRLADAHEVVPLVCRSLQRTGFDGVPPAARDALEASRRSTAARNALLARELAGVLRLLARAGVPAIPMKGVALAETLYGDAGLRVSSDMDVLVPRGHARKALCLLRDAGYASEFAERFFEALLLRTDIEYTLRRSQHRFEYVLDVHWGIGWSPRDDRRAAEALWTDSRRVTRWGVETYAMTPEWEVLTLAVHAARHGWQPLKWLVDVHDYCMRRSLDWQTVRDIAERFGWLPALRRTLGVCQQLLGTPTPPGITALPPEPSVPALAASADGMEPGPLLPLRLMGHVAERARYLLRLLLVPTLAERRLLRLPSALGLLYYPLRPVRLAGKWGWRALAGRSQAASR